MKFFMKKGMDAVFDELVSLAENSVNMSLMTAGESVLTDDEIEMLRAEVYRIYNEYPYKKARLLILGLNITRKYFEDIRLKKEHILWLRDADMRREEFSFVTEDRRIYEAFVNKNGLDILVDRTVLGETNEIRHIWFILQAIAKNEDGSYKYICEIYIETHSAQLIRYPMRSEKDDESDYYVSLLEDKLNEISEQCETCSG